MIMEEIKVKILSIKELEIQYLANGLEAGFIELEVHNNYRWFSNICSKKEFDEFFPSSKYLYLQSIYVDKKFRGKQIANKLMFKFISVLPKIKEKFNIDKIILTVDPFEFNIPVKALKQFYKKFGFEEPTNELMILSNIMIMTI
jgi:ribosomal protein S18 acetylase RimI-like enzyme